MDNLTELMHIFVRRYGLISASCCEMCCNQEVSLVQSHVLYEIRRKNNPSMQQVADELGIDITTFSRQIKALEGKGLVKKISHPEDRRVNLLFLTEKGKYILEQIDSHMSKKLEDIFSNMSDFERDTVIRSIKLLNSALRKSGSCCSI